VEELGNVFSWNLPMEVFGFPRSSENKVRKDKRAEGKQVMASPNPSFSPRKPISRFPMAQTRKSDGVKTHDPSANSSSRGFAARY
jgi:hypothetical protein